MFLKLRSAIYPAPDLAKARAWYVELLGKEPYFDEPYYIGFDIAGSELGLNPQGAPASGTGGPHTYWLVSDMQSALEHALELGAAALEPATDVGGGTTVAAVTDPWGNVIGLITEEHT